MVGIRRWVRAWRSRFGFPGLVLRVSPQNQHHFSSSMFFIVVQQRLHSSVGLHVGIYMSYTPYSYGTGRSS